MSTDKKYVTITIQVPFDELEVDYNVKVYHDTSEAWGQLAHHTEKEVNIDDLQYNGYQVQDWDDDELDAACLEDWEQR